MDGAQQAEGVGYDGLGSQDAARLRAAIGDCPDLTLVRGPSEAGHEPALAAVRALLGDRHFREIDVEELAGAEGRTALLAAGDAFPGVCHQWRRWALALAELRFERVIALPGGFDAAGSLDAAAPASPPSVADVRIGPEAELLLEEGVEPKPDAIQRLATELTAHPRVLALGARVEDAAGSERAGAGALREWDGVLEFRPTETDCEWLSGAAVVVRRAALAQLPLDPAFGRYAVREWCYRVQRTHQGALGRCPEAVVVDRSPPQPRRQAEDFADRCRALAYLIPIARFHRIHRRVIADVFEFLPGLLDTNGRRDAPAARALLTLLDGAGPERFLELWAGGGLERLIDGGDRSRPDELAHALERTSARLHAIEATRAWRLATGYYRLRDALRHRP